MHGFCNVEDPHGRWWRNLRAHLWVGDSERNRVSFDVGGEWVHGARFGGLRLKVSTSGEETLDVAYGLGWLVHHYWSINVGRRGRLVTKRYEFSTGPQDRAFRQSRQVRLWPRFRFVVEVGLTGCSWCFGRDSGGWDSRATLRERLRENDLKWWRVHWYRREHVELDKVETEVPLPEGSYPVTLTLFRDVRGVQVGPYRLSRRSKRRLRIWLPGWRRVYHTVDIEAPNGLPVPGNPESDFYDGQDAIYGTGCDVSEGSLERRQWVGYAVASAVQSVMRSRVRYGRGVADTGARV